MTTIPFTRLYVHICAQARVCTRVCLRMSVIFKRVRVNARMQSFILSSTSLCNGDSCLLVADPVVSDVGVGGCGGCFLGN